MGLSHLFVEKFRRRLPNHMAEDKEVRHCLQSVSRVKGHRLLPAMKLIDIDNGAITKNKLENKRSNLKVRGLKHGEQEDGDLSFFS
jgi:hypothetical protein